METAYGCTSMSIERFYRSQNLYRVLKRGEIIVSLGKGKVKGRPRIGHEGPEVEKMYAVLFLQPRR